MEESRTLRGQRGMCSPTWFCSPAQWGVCSIPSARIRSCGEHAERRAGLEAARGRTLHQDREAACRAQVQQFLDAAQAIIAEKGSTDFTVQEVVDRSRQSLRSFYQHFDGKHELLLALFEDALRRSADEIRAATTEVDPLDGLEVAVQMLFELSRPDPTAMAAVHRLRHPAADEHPAEVRSRTRPCSPCSPS